MSQRSHAAAVEMEARQLPDWKLAYRIPEAAAATGVSEQTIWRRINAGKILARKDQGTTVILRRDLQAYLDSLPQWSSKAA